MLGVAAFIFFASITATRALAISEACPAQIKLLTPVGLVSQASTSYVYELNAVSPRSIDATMIADTSGGWYTWDVSRTPLEAITGYLYYSNTQYLKYSDAASAPLGVVFPSPVLVHHAWVVRAKSSGETVIGWDAQGVHTCGLPAFSPDSTTEAQGYEGPPLAMPSPLPSPVAYAKATATTPPFPATDCKTRFAAVNINKPKSPIYPDGLYSPVVALVDITIDAQGKVIDATTRATSGSKSADMAATQAAAASSYVNGLAYCQPVGGHYLFRADFNPN